MRHFIAAKTSEKISRIYGGASCTFRVHEIMEDRSLRYVLSGKYCTRSWTGSNETEALQALARAGEIPEALKSEYYRRSATPAEHDITISEA